MANAGSSKSKKSKTKASDDPREALASFIRRLKRPRIESVGAEMTAFVKEAGPSIARIAEELGVLEIAARHKLVELAEVLLAAGVDPNLAPTDWDGTDRQTRALASAFSELAGPDDPAVAHLLGALLDAGAHVDTLYPAPHIKLSNSRHRTALDEAISRRATPAIQRLAAKASEQTRIHGLCTLLVKDRHRARDVEWDKTLDAVLGVAPVDGTDHDGMSPLHVAAARGELDIFSRIQDAARDKLPRLGAGVSWPVLISPPGGGPYPTLQFPAGATPLYVARSVQAKYEQVLALYKAPTIQPGTVARDVAALESTIAGHASIIDLLTSQGAVDDTQQAALSEPLEKVRRACTALAAHLGVSSFERDVAMIDPTNTGPFGFFLECAKLVRPTIDEAARARLDAHLAGQFVTNSLWREVVTEGDDDFDVPAYEWGPSESAFRVYFDSYPEDARKLLEDGKHYGVFGENLITLENSSGVTKLWEIGPERVIEHGEFTQWIVNQIAALTAAT
jgi:hypothetical protein